MIPPPPPGMSSRGLQQRDERLRRLGFALHRMHMRTLTAERHKAIKQSYSIILNTPTDPKICSNTLSSVSPMKSSPERQEKVQEYLRQRYSRPVSCTPAEIRSHYAGVFDNDSTSESHNDHFNELGVPREFPAFYGVRCRQLDRILTARNVSSSDVLYTHTSTEIPSTQCSLTPATTTTAPRHDEFSFETIRQRCNERIQTRVGGRMFTQLIS